ncbi:MAG TPA: hypothetical protein VF152_09005, partial [Acidimicrobiia bacterium]
AGAVERHQLHTEHTARLVSAATYGTVIALGALALATPGDVRSGFGIELVLGAGLATWVAHGFAELVGDQLRRGDDEEAGWAAIGRSALVGSPILLAALLQALALIPGRLEIVTGRTALWIGLVVGILELVAIGAFVAYVRRMRPGRMWRLGLAVAAVGVVVVVVKILLGRH